MIVRQVRWAPYRLAFRRPFATAHGVFPFREGVIVRVLTDDGRVGVGEAAPMPGFGGTLAEAERELSVRARSFLGLSLAAAQRQLNESADPEPSLVAAAFALDTALHDLQGQLEGVAIARLLGGDADRPIPVNATIGGGTARRDSHDDGGPAAFVEEAARAAQAAVAAGFRCVKLKVGIAGSDAAELARIGAVREAVGPGVALRLDANGAWEPDAAIRILRAAERFAIDLVEQPVAPDDLAGLARVRAAIAIPVAADEAVGGREQALQVIAASAADVLVVKPMLVGTFRHAREIIQRAGEAGLGVIVTTTLDAGVAVAAALHLAATLPDPPPCGLATGPLLTDDLIVEALAVENGWLRVPAAPGLGVRLDEDALRRHGGVPLVTDPDTHVNQTPA